MLKTIDSRIEVADTLLRGSDKKLYLVFKGSRSTFYRTSGISFSLNNKSDDAQELDLLMEITGVMGEGWQSQLVDKRVRLIVDINEIDRSDITIKIKAIGHHWEEDGDDDYFLVLNSKKQLVSQETAMKLITEKMKKESN